MRLFSELDSLIECLCLKGLASMYGSPFTESEVSRTWGGAVLPLISEGLKILKPLIPPKAMRPSPKDTASYILNALL